MPGPMQYLRHPHIIPFATSIASTYFVLSNSHPFCLVYLKTNILGPSHRLYTFTAFSLPSILLYQFVETIVHMFLSALASVWSTIYISWELITVGLKGIVFPPEQKALIQDSISPYMSGLVFVLARPMTEIEGGCRLVGCIVGDSRPNSFYMFTVSLFLNGTAMVILSYPILS